MGNKSNSRLIKIVNGKDDTKTITVDSVFLHSKYNPTGEADAYIKSNENIYINEEKVVVYGIGCGYHIKSLLENTDLNCKIIIFDFDKEVFNISKSNGFLDEIISNPRVQIFIGYNYENLDNLSKVLSYCKDILIWKPSLKVLPEEYSNIKTIIKDFEIGKLAVKKYSHMAQDNYLKNLRVQYIKIDKFIEDNSIKNKPIILVAAGPSLEIVVNDLKRLYGKVRIFAVGRALKYLMKNGIKPDMICIIDPQDIVYFDQLKDFENLAIPLCFLSTACNLAVKTYTGPKYMFYNEEREGTIKINTGRSVATAVLDIAIKTRANPIIFVGQDLAYLNNKTHSGLATDEGINKVNFKTVLGMNGEQLATTEGLLSFKRWIERTIQQNPSVTFVNCSKGAKIIGTVEKDISDLINTLI
ncbi:motility associated factor glycosyltransferase family protein [Clostridium sp. UBA4548]|uniref:motility associated factor glycosyltransferase family protein n=1 Tax=Clostridium sp. UBA4548 TaxID=1946361 RepID=UPI0025BCECD5|nr:6-hydroxymethylpterin diphosphokinase MptE-like protein [Clostridium sp. UBA4548]